MSLRVVRMVVVAALFSGAALLAAPSPGPGDCPNDSKLLNAGPTAVFGDSDGTWWGLIMSGLDAAGFADDNEKIAYLNSIFGTAYDNLADLKTFNLEAVDAWDENRNGFVCAFELRGTRAYLDNPYVNETFFGIGDDHLRKK
jgi:hypothetical protein